MALSIWSVDAFTTKPFSGNPAGVCIIEKYDEKLCQQIAAEMNLSETAFLVPIYDSKNNQSSITNKWHLRWWTPSIEVNFCGHATLASTHLLYSKGFVNINETVQFNTKSGLFYASKPDKSKDEYLMDFPALLSSSFDGNYDAVTSFLNLKDSNELIMNIVNSGEDLLIELKDINAVEQCTPLIDEIKRNFGSYRCIIITAKDGNNFDFKSRVFAPNCGVDEDPVTGSAHSSLGVYWSQKLNKCNEWLLAYQSSKRGGNLKVKFDTGKQRINIVGSAVTVMNANMMVRSKL
eukprot:341810_1